MYNRKPKHWPEISSNLWKHAERVLTLNMVSGGVFLLPYSGKKNDSWSQNVLLLPDPHILCSLSANTLCITFLGGRESEAGLSAQIIRWHFTQSCVWMRASVFLLSCSFTTSVFLLAWLFLPLLLCPSLSLSFDSSFYNLLSSTGNSLSFFFYVSVAGWRHQRWETLNLTTCTFWTCRVVETELASAYCLWHSFPQRLHTPGFV